MNNKKNTRRDLAIQSAAILWACSRVAEAQFSDFEIEPIVTSSTFEPRPGVVETHIHSLAAFSGGRTLFGVSECFDPLTGCLPALFVASDGAYQLVRDSSQPFVSGTGNNLAFLPIGFRNGQPVFAAQGLWDAPAGMQPVHAIETVDTVGIAHTIVGPETSYPSSYPPSRLTFESLPFAVSTSQGVIHSYPSSMLGSRGFFRANDNDPELLVDGSRAYFPSQFPLPAATINRPWAADFAGNLLFDATSRGHRQLYTRNTDGHIVPVLGQGDSVLNGQLWSSLAINGEDLAVSTYFNSQASLLLRDGTDDWREVLSSADVDPETGLPFSSFVRIALGNLADNPFLAFLASSARPDTTSAFGLYVYFQGQLQRIVGTGDTVDGHTVNDLYFDAGMMDGTSLAFSLGFTDRSMGIYSVDLEPVPLPASVWLLGTALLAGAYLRRQRAMSPFQTLRV